MANAVPEVVPEVVPEGEPEVLLAHVSLDSSTVWANTDNDIDNLSISGIGTISKNKDSPTKVGGSVTFSYIDTTGLQKTWTAQQSRTFKKKDCVFTGGDGGSITLSDGQHQVQFI
ncbi:MAG: hypothetical protein Q9219_007138 [cf. Caloplaca sp. 3 TL-2023]